MPVPKGIIVIVKRAQRVNTNKPIIAYECLIYKEKSPCAYACRSPCSIYWRSKKKKKRIQCFESRENKSFSLEYRYNAEFVAILKKRAIFSQITNDSSAIYDKLEILFYLRGHFNLGQKAKRLIKY